LVSDTDRDAGWRLVGDCDGSGNGDQRAVLGVSIAPAMRH
jgi:hypothetical protein